MTSSMCGASTLAAAFERSLGQPYGFSFHGRFGSGETS